MTTLRTLLIQIFIFQRIQCDSQVSSFLKG